VLDDSQFSPALRAQDPPLHHMPTISVNVVFIYLKDVKPPADMKDRNNFIHQDMCVDQDEVDDIWPEPEINLLRVAFFTIHQYQWYHGRMQRALVYGSAPGDATTTDRLTGVPIALPDTAVHKHFFWSKQVPVW